MAEQRGLKLDTLRKALRQGRLTELRPLEPGESALQHAHASPPPTPTDKFTRAVLDAEAERGAASTRPDQRVLAAFGLLDDARRPHARMTAGDAACFQSNPFAIRFPKRRPCRRRRHR